jgi:hypothetical protein
MDELDLWDAGFEDVDASQLMGKGDTGCPMWRIKMTEEKKEAMKRWLNTKKPQV